MIAALLLAIAPAPGRVVLAGEGAALDAALCAELSASGRIVLDATWPGSPVAALDPMEAAGPACARYAIGGDAGNGVIVDEVRAASCIVLAGGDAVDWYHRFFPQGHPSRLVAALREAHASGATIAGAGASAPWLASWAMAEWSDLGKTRRNPRRVRDDVAVRALGVAEGFLVDSSACLSGGPARVLRAAFDGFVETVLYLDGAAVVLVDPTSRSARILGTGSVLLFDFSTARRGRDTWNGGRLSILGAGDGWSSRGGPELAESALPAGSIDDPRLDALLEALAAASASCEIFVDERTRTRASAAFVDVGFDLAWPRNGS